MTDLVIVDGAVSDLRMTATFDDKISEQIRLDDKQGTYQIQLAQPFRCVRQVDNCVVSQVGAVSQNQSLQLRKLVNTPMLKSAICNCCAASEINTLQSCVSMHCKMSHRTISDMFAVRKSKAL